MKHNPKKFLVEAIFTLFLLFLTSTFAYTVDEDFIIIQSPPESNITIDSPVNVTVINNQLESISSIFLFYCSLEPEFLCHFPSIEMEKNEQGNFFAFFIPDYEINTIFGYHLKINMVNGSDFEVPNNLDYSSDYNIQQGPDNNYYFELTIVEGSSSENTTPWLSIEGILTFTLSLSVLNRKISKQ